MAIIRKRGGGTEREFELGNDGEVGLEGSRADELLDEGLEDVPVRLGLKTVTVDRLR